MRIVSLICLALLSFVFIKGQKNDSVKVEIIDNIPHKDNKIEDTNDSVVGILQEELNKAIKLQEENRRLYEVELESDRAVIAKQKELILTLLKDR